MEPSVATAAAPAKKLVFTSDYTEGAHPALLQALIDTNREQTAGYGWDEHSINARELIRTACAAPKADVWFLTGGTQTNSLVLKYLTSPWEGIMAAFTGHIATHEAGAIEGNGHKVLALPAHEGKVDVADVHACIAGWEADGNAEHMIAPGVLYISQPTEYGTLYSLTELEALSAECHAHGVRLYCDGARLAYALATPQNDVALPDLARLCDVFYIGGTKCGALFGEAVVIPRGTRNEPGNGNLIPHFFTLIKQNGALLAKGRIAGVQFETLFSDDLYLRIGKPAIEAADRIRARMAERGITQYINSPTNQIFLALDAAALERFSRAVDYGFWENLPDGRTVIRLATSWATSEAAVDALLTHL